MVEWSEPGNIDGRCIAIKLMMLFPKAQVLFICQPEHDK